jgi:hypothetical protein
LSTTALRIPIKRKLACNDGSRRRRPFFIEIDPAGVIRLWPRRCEPKEISVMRAYKVAIEDEVAAKRAAKARASGKPIRVKRGLL